MNRINNEPFVPLKAFFAVIEAVDMKVVENIDFLLPGNARYKLKSASVVTGTQNGTLSVGCTLALQAINSDGTTLDEVKVTAAALATTGVVSSVQDLTLLNNVKTLSSGQYLRIAKTVVATVTTQTADVVLEFVLLN